MGKGNCGSCPAYGTERQNRPSIIMWSMGNESAYGCNFEKALAWTKKFDPDRITQYESARYRNYDITYDYENLDLYSRMYPSLQEIEDYLKMMEANHFCWWNTAIVWETDREILKIIFR